MKLTWGESRFLVILPMMYYVRKRRLIVLINALFGTIACSESLRRLPIVTVTAQVAPLNTGPRRNYHQQMVVTYTVRCWTLQKGPQLAPLPRERLYRLAPLPPLHDDILVIF